MIINLTTRLSRLVVWSASTVVVVSGVVTGVVLTAQNGPAKTKVLGEQFVAPKANANTSNGCGNGGSIDCSNPGHPINVTGQVLSALLPGSTSTLRVTVSNPNNQALTLTTIHVTVGTPTAAGCLASWFTVSDFSGSQSIAKNSSANIDLPLAMVNTPTTNQDVCQTAKIPLSFTATVNG